MSNKIKIRVKIKCSNCPTKKKFWVQAFLTGTSNYIRLNEDYYPKNWQRLNDDSVICPDCAAEISLRGREQFLAYQAG